eukprot:1021460-Amphidinium_carterae.1
MMCKLTSDDDQHHMQETQTPKLGVAQQLPTYKTHVELNALDGLEWQQFQAHCSILQHLAATTNYCF